MNRLPLSRGFAALLLAAGALGFSACSCSNDGNRADANSSGGEGGQAASDNTSDTSDSSDTETTSAIAAHYRIGGEITEPRTLGPSDDCPDGYKVVENLVVYGNEATLTIEPGTTL